MKLENKVSEMHELQHRIATAGVAAAVISRPRIEGHESSMDLHNSGWKVKRDDESESLMIVQVKPSLAKYELIEFAHYTIITLKIRS